MEMKCQQKIEQIIEDIAKAETAAKESVQQMLIATEREKKQALIAEARKNDDNFSFGQSFLLFSSKSLLLLVATIDYNDMISRAF